ncbi:MAG TPA: glycosyl hydrolase [Cytophagaceae bacterium]|nr:glycosyl hydrolase [Cytophagaceae bacterium]
MGKYKLQRCIWSGIISILLVIITSPFLQAQVSPKRGYGYGYNSVADLQEMATGCSWWYNWAAFPDGTVQSVYQNIGVEFVPMSWGGTPDYNTLMSQIPSGAKYLLGFNEPNFTTEANMTPQVAAQRWPVLQQVAQSKGLKLVAPAVNYCGGGCNQTDPIAWLDTFFLSCTNCQVDFIAIHWYQCTGGGLTWDLSQFKKYGKPLWLTEFACGTGSPTVAAQQTYMTEALSILENDPDVYRYAWFAGRTTSVPNASLLGNSGQFTSLGQTYASLPFPALIQVPGIIQSENYYRRLGVNTETCTDTGGGLDVGWTSSGDFMDYNLNIASAGTFNFFFRIASLSGGGSFHLELDDKVISTSIAVPITGAWQAWSTINLNNLSLPAGNHLLRVVVESGGFNMNYINTVQTSVTTALLPGVLLEEIKLYPNPFQGSFTIDFSTSIGLQKVEIFQSSGMLVNSYQGSDLNQGTLLIGENLGNGIYFVKCTGNDGVKVSKIIKN